MARRSTSKPLYELMVTDRRRGQGEPASPVEDASDSPEDATLGAGRLISTLSVGRSIRLPVGYLVLAVPAVIVAVIIAYMFGAWRGEMRAKQDGDRFIADFVGDDAAWKASDPLTEGPVAGEGAESGAGMSSLPAPIETGRGGTPSGEDTTAGGLPPGGDGLIPDAVRWADIESDPREPGRYYLVLAETRLAGARRLAGFLRERELEAYIVPSNNPGLRRVVVLPGFDSSSESDPDVARLVEAVRRVGRAWKAEYPFESDLSDAYLAPS